MTVLDRVGASTPESARAGLKELAVSSDGKRRRTWAVLGAMAGQDRLAHMDLGRFLVRLDISHLVAVGSAAGAIHAGAVLEGSWGEESVHVPDADAAVDLLREQLAPTDVVLLAGPGLEGLRRGLRTAGPS